METILIPNSEVNGQGGCLKEYLENDRQKTKHFLLGESATRDSEIFEKNIFNITNRLDKFLVSPEKEVAFLVLGKIQSGKTANLLGTIAWAADSKISLAIIFTGITEALNDQTEKRIRKDLMTKLNEQYVKVYQVPTTDEGNAFAELFQNVSKWVGRRLTDQNLGLNKSLPVLVTLKNPSRVKTLKSLIEKLREKYGSNLISLLIDDEADQASQNAGARKKKVTATYAAIKALRDIDSRNILLSYTATPQAVLLTEKNGRLRPNYCVTVEPRSGYFGLENAVGLNFTNNRIIVEDWDLKPTQMSSSPLSLRKALIRFSWTAWIRFKQKELFYVGSGLSEDLLPHQLKSVQMLVHESGSQKEHKAVYKLVTEELEVLTEALSRAVSGDLPQSQINDLVSQWEIDLQEIRAGLPSELQTQLYPRIDGDFFKQILGLIDDISVLVVNSDPSKPGPEDDIPIENEVWEQAKLWILIGGDILGRGLTIPQLTTTYFLRHAKKPNFDTVSQQMRFCGYRSNYSYFTYLFAQEQTFGIFEVMNQIDTAVWRLAKKWDKSHLDIYREMPVVMYASKPDVKLDPCRKAVHDPNLIDKRIGGEFIFSIRDIFNPNNFKENLSLLQNFFLETRMAREEKDKWYIFPEPSDAQMQRILSTWIANNNEHSHLVGTAELFVPELEELGLSNIPRNIVVNKTLLESSPNNIDSLISNIEVTRQVTSSGNKANISIWERTYSSILPTGSSTIEWPVLAVQHVGGGQRAVRNKLSPNSTTLLIEPLFGHTRGREGTPVAVGIAFTLMNPPGFEVRMIGLEARIEAIERS